MKTLKLEIGKTYRSRSGKVVKIVEKDSGMGAYPCKGSDGERYAENGGFTYTTETPYDLIEEVTIPDVKQKHNEMKTLKLEVGKTYRSREGEEVKIVRMGNRGWDYWNGSNGEWYYEGGKWSYSAEEHPKDLIEEVPEPTRHTFDVPDGVKKITVSRVGNCIVVEMSREEGEPKPKTIQAKNECLAHTSEDVKKMINLREMNKVLTRIKKVYQLKDIDVKSRLWRQVEARAIWTYYLIEVEGIQHADAAKVVGRKRPLMYYYVKLVEDLYETNVPFRERFDRIGIPWRS